MRILSLTAPYGTLVELRWKGIETRSWSTNYRGPIAIHQAKGLGPVGGLKGLLRLVRQRYFFEALYRIVPGADRHFDADAIVPALPLGFIVAVAELIDVVPTWPEWAEKEPWFRAERKATGTTWQVPATGTTWQVPPLEPERSFGDYRPGRYAWLLADVRPLHNPLPYRGAQGLRTLPAEVAEAIYRRAA